ncbi:undecaprenyldiphospho-muramoylpentapeptide beta-N-acetylglucosaminyltransferase [Thermoflexus sp.]|uniref:undecaprenyldiphospho-muramoylpentapeptide beta-N-acetylglucosaminyltransferase n=1 Tax=Thermoflexus sp. TaxID=1969742 RepID=UPI002ADD80BA|nr:undecaprenyldiphospho-muramoylpentapeptide beta-N-acetylglucosaminyltransferase [Thermoflexus sp.]
MRIWIAAGGTGGHIYPALAVAEALRAVDPNLELIWVGTREGMEARLIPPRGYPFLPVEAGGVYGMGWRRGWKGLWRVVRGTLQAWREMGRRRPQVVFTTGGFVSIPAALAAAGSGVPILVYLPDIEPGLAVRILSRLAAWVAVTAPEAGEALRRPAVVTGYPVRRALVEAARSQEETRQRGLARWRFHPEVPVVLVFGGSRGARRLNQAVARHLETLTAEAQVLHLTGPADLEAMQRRRMELPPEGRVRYQPVAYLDEEMGEALAMADLAVCRAGASTLGELPLFGLPAVLVPYPYVRRHQERNAAYLVRHGGAVMIPDEEIEERLGEVVRDLLRNPGRLSEMRRRMAALARPEAADRLAALVMEQMKGLGSVQAVRVGRGQ